MAMLGNMMKTESKKPLPVLHFQHGGIVTKKTEGIIGEAGVEGVFPLAAFYNKFDEMIDSNKANKPHEPLANWEYRSSW